MQRFNYEFKQVMSEKDFMRNLFYGLSVNENTPSDILSKAKFCNPICKYAEYFVVKANVSMTFSAYIKPANREDWTYFKHTYKAKKTVPMINDKNVNKNGVIDESWKAFSDSKPWLFMNNGGFNSENYVENNDLDSVEICDNALSAVKNDLLMVCRLDVYNEFSNSTIPSLEGVHLKYKNFEVLSYDIDIINIDYYKVPIYEIEYTYQNKKYKNSSFAYGEGLLLEKTPKIDKQQVLEKKVKPLDTLSLFINIFTLIVSVLAFINIESGLTLPMFTIYLSPIMLFVCLISFIVLSKRRKKRIARFDQSNLDLKKKAYINHMSKYGLGTPSAQTLSGFNKSVRTNVVVKTGLRTFTVVMFVLAMIASFMIMVSGGGFYYLFELLENLNV